MSPIAFVSSNLEKFAIAKHACDEAGLIVEQIFLDIDEIQGEDPEIIVKDKAMRAFEQYGKPVVVSDDSWSIPALNGFPGPYMKSMNHWFTPEDFIRLMHGVSDRSAFLHQFLAYYDGTAFKVFTRDIPGVITQAARGNGGNAPWMRVIELEIDEGKTLAEIFERPQAALSKRYQQRHDAWHDLVEWYKDKYEN